ncbi:MAG: efflux RND transporter periplasmic adaptor subunit [Candidatus Latescibacterota bacterium]|nr:MAG: efflux RND transporter periplasmic adaptor subunit [Candidatus Latescibacterota bacterium]
MRRYLPFVVIAGLLFQWSCGGEHEQKGGDENGEPVVVRVVQAAIEFAEEPVEYSASVEPADEANIAGKVMGKVERIFVREGDSVERGQLLVKLQGEDVRARLAQASAGVAEAMAHFQNARRNLDRFESLFEDNAATQKELDDVRAAYEAASARVQAAQEMKREVEELMQYVQVVAPFSGVVTKTYVDIGDLATPGQPILKLENVRQLEVVASVPESQIEHLSVGMPVKILIPARRIDAPEQDFYGSVDQIIPSADPGSHQFEIKAFIQNPGGAVRSGMFARIVVSRSQKERLMVPVGAVFKRGQLEGIFVVGPEARVQLRWVRTGRRIGGSIEILSGLDPGESVVVGTASPLKDAQRVEVAD